MCAGGLALHKEIKTDCSVSGEYKGKTYCFGNEQAKTDFMKDPQANLKKAEAYYGRRRG
jgi:YHS domain-containing protein